jgi:RND family efflux transporter MFP subunit
MALYGATLDYLYAKANYEIYVKEKQEAQELAVAIAEQEVAYAQATVDRLRQRLAQARLFAPFSGMIVAIDARVGDKAEPYAPIGAIANPTVMAVEATVAETDLAYVVVGQQALVVLDGFPTNAFAAQVKTIASKPTVWQGRTVYQVTLQFDLSAKVPATFRMGADVRISTRVQPNVLMVPAQAVFTLDTHTYVEVMEAGKKRRVAVEIGMVGEHEVEIVSGLRAGDMVVVP